nr:MAG TPA: hypothetical protein [Caudoviricetes sp.]
MKFRITATLCGGEKGRMIERYPFLKDKVKTEQLTTTEETLYGSFTSTHEECFIEIATLEELIKLGKMCGKEIIILTDDEPEIEIYDAYRE